MTVFDGARVAEAAVEQVTSGVDTDCARWYLPRMPSDATTGLEHLDTKQALR